MMGKVIAIDGPSGAGKSTVARMLAERLGFTYLDTGAFYRAVALLFLKKGITPDDDDKVLEVALRSTEIQFEQGKVILNERDVSSEIRTPEVGHYSSVFSSRKVVRDFLLDVQRNAASDHNLVVEGRDTTTVVFPGAYKKFYMNASMEERTRRRHRQLVEMGIQVTGADAEKDVRERDERDQGRDIAPLTKAKDAIIIETTGKSIEQILDTLMEVVRVHP